VKFRLPAAAAVALVAAAALAPSALAASSTVVIQQVAFRGPTGGNDEIIQLKNISSSAQDIGGWQLWGSNNTGSSTSARATIPTGITLPAGKSYLLANVQAGGTGASGGSYSGSVTPDQTYTTGISDGAAAGGLQLRNAAQTVVDAVGSTALSGAGTAYREGAGLSFPTANGGDAFIRRNATDTDDNVADFQGPQAAAPEACGTDCAGGGTTDPCPATGIVPISQIQTLGSNSACDNRTVTVRGVITGVDDEYGSTYDAVYKGDSGVWLQEATHNPAATTSEALFVAGVKRNPASPADVVGDNITITGKIVTQFGLVELVPNGVGSVSSPAATEVNLADVATINSTGNALPDPIAIDHAKAASQDPLARPYYRSLQGMRVSLDEGIATGGGTTKFNDVYLQPGHTAARLFRKNSPAADTTPWTDAPDELGIAPDGGAHDPPQPTTIAWRSDTQVDMDLFDVAHDVVGPLTYTFSYYEIMPQLGQPQPTVQRGAINAAYPPAAPDQPADTLRYASFNVENYFPVGEVNDGITITADQYARQTGQIVKDIHNFLKDPDVIAVQEDAAFADGANALTGLAQALGDYSAYNAVNNDPRGITPGFLIKTGTTASNPRLLGKGETYAAHSEGTCDLNGGPLYERAPFALDITKGDLTTTVISNHFASQSHEEACRIAEAEYLRQQVDGMVAAGKNVIVSGDLNDFETSPALTRLTQTGSLTNLWDKAPAGDAYSYKFDGHLQTLDHVLVSAGVLSRESDVRYIHFDNDYYARPTGDGTGESDHDPPLATFTLAKGAGTSTDGTVTGTVPSTLALTLGAPAGLGAFLPGVSADYTGAMTAQVTSSAADVALSVLDSSNTATGRLVNGAFALAQPLQVNAGGAFAPLRSDNGPLLLKSWTTPLTLEPVSLNFKQHVDASEALRTGSYSKTLTFTLTTTNP
jgi:predicted extracellular nuclease